MLISPSRMPAAKFNSHSQSITIQNLRDDQKDRDVADGMRVLEGDTDREVLPNV